MTGIVELALDAGQTGTKVRMVRGGENLFSEVLPGIRTHEPLLPQLADAVRHVRSVSGIIPSTISAGVSGLTEHGADAEMLLSLLADVGVDEVLLAHDSITSFLGTIGDVQGAVVASGTGVVTLAVGRDAVARVDGWGNIMGDAGSAYWIGREALEHGMRAFDGRGPHTEILQLMRQRWPSLDEAYIELQSADDRVRIVASFAEQVAALAQEGDAVANDVCFSAANELAHSVSTALRRVAVPRHNATIEPAVSAIGGVFRSNLIRSHFESQLRKTHPMVRFEAPHGNGLDGAVALPRLPASHPLRDQVAVASAHR